MFNAIAIGLQQQVQKMAVAWQGGTLREGRTTVGPFNAFQRMKRFPKSGINNQPENSNAGANLRRRCNINL